MKQLFKQQNKPVVYVTHDQTEAMTLSTRVAVLYNGLLQQLDRPNRIYTHPANQFVAGFVGSPQMNLLTLKCQEKTAVLGEYKIPLADLTAVPAQIVLGIRPEDVRLAQPEDSFTIEGKVFLVEAMGKENLVSIQIQGSKLTLRVLLPDDRYLEGDTVTLALPQTQIHWFDVETGDRL
jgi:multiple sugar transport system ATP-binding protein